MATAAETVATQPESRPVDPARWFVLGVVLCGAILIMCAVSVLNLAVPAMRQSLHASVAEIQLVIVGYTLVYAIFLVAGGRLGDIYGRQRVFLAGVAVFTVATAACGLAPSAPALIGARALQGFGAALMYPQFLSIIQDTFEGDERNLALALFGAVIGAGFVIGLLFGGTVISLNIAGQSWRPALLLLVPIGAVAFEAGRRYLGNRPSSTATSMDWAGVAGLGVALVLFIIPLLTGRAAGWPAWMIVMLAASVPAFAVFLSLEGRMVQRGRPPLLDPGLFRQRSFVVGCLMGIAFMTGMLGFFFVLSVTLQVGLGLPAIGAGLAQAPMGVMFLAGSLLAPRLLPGLGRHVLTLGYGILILGALATLATAAQAGSSLQPIDLVPGLMIIGLGQGLGLAPLIGTVMSSIRRDQLGAAAGGLTTAFQVGLVLGLALLSLVFLTALGQGSGRGAYVGAFEAVLPFEALLAALCLLLVFALPGPVGDRENVLLERVPNRLAGLIYSFYFSTGGHVGRRSLADLVGHIAQHRRERVVSAPREPGGLLVHHYDELGHDAAWLRYLVEEALAMGAGPVPHEDERVPVLALQVDEIRSRQAEGLIADCFDPALLRVLVFASSSYPRLLPQVVRMATGLDPESEEFRERWRNLLRQIGERLA